LTKGKPLALHFGAPAIHGLRLASIVTTSLAVLVVGVGLAFGLRDAWITGAGINGSWVGGIAIAALSLIPILCVLTCIKSSFGGQ
jgi:hypothetical protein